MQHQYKPVLYGIKWIKIRTQNSFTADLTSTKPVDLSSLQNKSYLNAFHTLRKVHKISQVQDVILNFRWVVEIRFVNFGQEVLMGNLEKFLKVFIIPLIFSQIFIVIQTPSFHSYTIVFKRYVSKCVSAFCYMVFVYFWQIRLLM